MSSEKSRIVLSVGGNALTMGPGRETIADQREAAAMAARIVAKVFRSGAKTALTHGNGPQSGFILRRFEFAQQHGILHPVPLDAVVADTQGAIGYMLEQLIHDELQDKDPEKADLLATLVTQAFVDPADPAFREYTKPIGEWMTEATAKAHQAEEGWTVKQMKEGTEKGWRRVVASPEPIGVTNGAAIRHSFDGGFLTICGGGGGIPVVRKPNGTLEGVPAVIDKDSITKVIAELVRADMMAVLTAAPGVIDPEEFKRNHEKGKVIPVIKTSEARTMLPDLQKGSMGPKVKACVDFTAATGSDSLITNFESALEAFQGKAGTRIVAD